MNKIEKNIIKSFSIIIGIVLLVFIVLNVLNLELRTANDYFSKHYALGWTNFNVYGSVKNKYIGKAHNNPTILVRDTSGEVFKFYFQTNDTNLYNYVNIGDSLSSKKKSFSAKVWNNDKAKTFKFTE